jgi:hypothetical protein
MNERKGLIKQAIANQIQSSDMRKTMFAVVQEQIDGLIGGVKTDLEQVRITTTELNIKVGQLWRFKNSPTHLAIVTKTTPNAVRYAYATTYGVPYVDTRCKLVK